MALCTEDVMLQDAVAERMMCFASPVSFDPSLFKIFRDSCMLPWVEGVLTSLMMLHSGMLTSCFLHVTSEGGKFLYCR